MIFLWKFFIESDTERDRLLAMKCFKALSLIGATFACLPSEKVEYYKLTVKTPAGQGRIWNFEIHYSWWAIKSSFYLIIQVVKPIQVVAKVTCPWKCSLKETVALKSGSYFSKCWWLYVDDNDWLLTEFQYWWHRLNVGSRRQY